MEPFVKTPDPIVQQLQADVAQLQREMRAALAALQAPRAPIGRHGDTTLLTALHARIGPGIGFSAVEVVQHATLDSALRATLTAAGLNTVSAIGRRLSKLGRRGLLERVGKDAAGVVWCLHDAK